MNVYGNSTMQSKRSANTKVVQMVLPEAVSPSDGMSHEARFSYSKGGGGRGLESRDAMRVRAAHLSSV
jgi:hypothetical protein